MAKKDTEAEQVLDINSLEMEDVPEGEKIETSEEEEEQEEQEENEEEESPDEEEEEGEEETEEERIAREKEEAEEEETDEEKLAREKKEAKKEDDEPSKLFEGLAEKYDINDEEELTEILDNTQKVLEDLKDTEAKLEEAKDAKPTFKSPKEEKAYEFIQKYGVDKFANGLGAYASLIGMEPDDMNEKLALQEAYVLGNPNLDREDAVYLFNNEYKKKYDLDRESFEEEAEYDRESKLRSIQKKKEVSDARSFLNEQKEKFSAPDKPDGEKDDKPKTVEANPEAVKKYSKAVDESMNDFNSLIFEVGKDKDNSFTYKLSEKQLNKVDLALKNYVNDSRNYNDKGEIANFDAEQSKVNVSAALFGLEMVEEAIKHGITLGETKKVDGHSKRKPTRKAKSSTPKDGDELGVMDQFEQLGEETAKKRGTGSHSID